VPTKWCTAEGTNRRLVEGFDIKYRTVLFMSEQRRWEISVAIGVRKIVPEFILDDETDCE